MSQAQFASQLLQIAIAHICRQLGAERVTGRTLVCLTEVVQVALRCAMRQLVPEHGDLASDDDLDITQVLFTENAHVTFKKSEEKEDSSSLISPPWSRVCEAIGLLIGNTPHDLKSFISFCHSQTVKSSQRTCYADGIVTFPRPLPDRLRFLSLTEVVVQEQDPLAEKWTATAAIPTVAAAVVTNPTIANSRKERLAKAAHLVLQQDVPLLTTSLIDLPVERIHQRQGHLRGPVTWTDSNEQRGLLYPLTVTQSIPFRKKPRRELEDKEMESNDKVKTEEEATTAVLPTVVKSTPPHTESAPVDVPTPFTAAASPFPTAPVAASPSPALPVIRLKLKPPPPL